MHSGACSTFRAALVSEWRAAVNRLASSERRTSEDVEELRGNHTLPSRKGADLSEDLRACLCPAGNGVLGHLATLPQRPGKKDVAFVACRLKQVLGLQCLAEVVGGPLGREGSVRQGGGDSQPLVDDRLR
jgi:hypothetical protein